MEDVIRKIIDIETEAQMIIDSAEKEKINRTNELEGRLKSLKIKLIQDAHKKVASIREKEISATNAVASQRAMDCAGKLTKIQEVLDQSGEEWSDDLVKAVLKR
ncbi:MAG: hypothetical protein H7X94_06385 [Vallitaleaceae bacterium]|nr:hypothetical protein [Vallitaleaceae bacterium]